MAGMTSEINKLILAESEGAAGLQYCSLQSAYIVADLSHEISNSSRVVKFDLSRLLSHLAAKSSQKHTDLQSETQTEVTLSSNTTNLITKYIYCVKYALCSSLAWARSNNTTAQVPHHNRSPVSNFNDSKHAYQ